MNSAQTLDQLFENALAPGWYEVLRKKGGFLGGKFSDDAYFDGSRWTDKAQQPISNVIQVGGPAQGPPPMPPSQTPFPRTAQTPSAPRSPIRMSPSQIAQAQGSPSPATVAAANTVLPAPAATPTVTPAPVAAPAATPTSAFPAMPLSPSPSSRPGWYIVQRPTRSGTQVTANTWFDGGDEWFDSKGTPCGAPTKIVAKAKDPRPAFAGNRRPRFF